MPAKPQDVDQYFKIGCGRCLYGGTPDCKVVLWKEELALLRKILQRTALVETIKWSAPCYTHEGRNILTLSALKSSAVVSFFRGAEMSDPKNLLERPGENSRYSRYLRFTNKNQVSSRKQLLLDYVQDAIQVEQTNAKPQPSADVALDHPAELLEAFATHPQLKKAFLSLTPGRQRGYLIHFSSAKQSQTRTARIQKCMPKILDGKGWNEW